jgi:PPOX class probable F420-dependent enzyme
MTEIPASHRDLLEKSQVAILATEGADGFPQVTANWFLVDEDGRVRLSLTNTRQKIKNMQRRPEATLFFIDPDNPYRTLELRSRVEIAPDADYAFADRVGAKYGADVRSFDQPGQSRVVVKFDPVKVNTYG